MPWQIGKGDSRGCSDNNKEEEGAKGAEAASANDNAKKFVQRILFRTSLRMVLMLRSAVGLDMAMAVWSKARKDRRVASRCDK